MGKRKELPPIVADNAVDAVADAWASIDGKLTEYRRGKKAKSILAFGGHFAGYQAEAEELIRRIKRRGYVLHKHRHRLNRKVG